MLAGRFVLAVMSVVMVIAMRFAMMRVMFMRVSARYCVAVFAVALLRAGKDVDRTRMMLAQLILPARREDEEESHQCCESDLHSIDGYWWIAGQSREAGLRDCLARLSGGVISGSF